MLKFFNKANKETLDKGLEKTKENFFSKLGKAVAGKSKVDGQPSRLLLCPAVGIGARESLDKGGLPMVHVSGRADDRHVRRVPRARRP